MSIITTPVGEFLYTVVNEQGKYNKKKEAFEYCANVLYEIDSEEAKAIKKIVEDFFNEKKSLKFKEVYLPFKYWVKDGNNYIPCKEITIKEKGVMRTAYATDEEDGVSREPTHIAFVASQTVEQTIKGETSKVEIPVYDAQKNRVKLGSTLVGNGSKGRIKAFLHYFSPETTKKAAKQGVTSYLKVVQITELVKYTGADFSDDDDVEGSFIVESDTFDNSEEKLENTELQF